MLSIKCSEENCDGMLLYNKDETYCPCQSCQCVVTDTTDLKRKRSIMDEAKEVIQKIDELKKAGDADAQLTTCEEMLAKQRALSPFNVYHVKMLDRALDACIDRSLWQQAVGYGERTIQSYLKLHPPFSPTVGIQLMKLGKLQLYIQQLPAALSSLQQAESILSVTHGKSHSVCKELAQLLDQCGQQSRLAVVGHS